MSLSFAIFSGLLMTISSAPLINRYCLHGELDVRFTREPDGHDFYCRDICTENFKHYDKICLNDPNVMKHCAAFVNCTITPTTPPSPSTTPLPTQDSGSLALKIAAPTAVTAGIILLAIVIAVYRFLNNKVPNENQEIAGEHEDQVLMVNPDVHQAVDRNKSSLVHVVPNKVEKDDDL
ncbi:unnamed protein product [Owenia fusiformis]|uniref:Uncharacterized protein n=1 Tax=Owenia fusiformis TaxID=6347 RepID=A0A8J1UMB5_OWEFU|nr:unnamed protein product [Owenia fusiformis]